MKCWQNACLADNQTRPLIRTTLAGFRERANTSLYFHQSNTLSGLKQEVITFPSGHRIPSVCNTSPDGREIVAR